MRILIVDPHPIMRVGMQRVLGDEILGAAFGEASSSAEAVEHVRQEEWDVVTIELSLPDRTGLETLKDIHALRPHLPALVLTNYAEDQYALRAFRAGAAGYLCKGCSLADLVSAVHKVAAGGKFVSPRVAERLVTNLHDNAGGALDATLSDRELQVLRMFGGGKSVKQIGVELGLSPKTVSTYRGRILEKMHMQTTAQLVRYAVSLDGA